MTVIERPILSLDGLWDFTFEGPTARLDASNRRIRSPGVWQSQFPELRNAHGTGRYRRAVEIPEPWAGRRLVLVLEGVFHESAVFVDGRRVASHPDGWTTFEVDLTDALAGRRAFTLGVDAHVPDDRDDGRFSRSMAAKQDWYGVQGGIWKTARIEARDPLHLARVAVRTDYDLATGTVVVRGALSQAAPASLRLTLRQDGQVVAERETPLPGPDFEATLALGSPDAWSPDAPDLYDLTIALLRDGAPCDAVERRVGFRRFEAKGGKLLLNGAPFYLVAALDQDWTEDAA